MTEGLALAVAKLAANRKGDAEAKLKASVQTWHVSLNGAEPQHRLAPAKPKRPKAVEPDVDFEVVGSFNLVDEG